MKKTSKILSLLVALCMAVTMLSGLTVFAADPFELVSIDADSDFITLVFDQEVDTTNSTIVLKKGDEFVDFEFKKNNVSSNSSYPVQTRLTYHSYQVIPEGGIDLEEEYKITFWDVKSKDGVSTLAQEAYTFVVTDLGGQLTSARGATIDNNARSSSETFNADGTITMNFTKNNAKYTQTETSYLATTVGEDYLSGVTVANNRDATLPYYAASETSGPVTEKDYTIKVDFSNLTNYYTGHLGIGITDNINRMFTASYKYSTGVYFHLQTQTAAGKTHAFLTDKFAKKADDALGTELGGQYDQTQINGNYVVTNVSRTAPIELKLAVKDGIARAYINGKLAADNVLARDYRGYAYVQGEIIKMADNSSTTTNDPGEGSMTVSNFLATRATFVPAEEIDTPEGYVPPAPPEPEEPQEPEEEEYPELINNWDADLNVFTVDFTEEVQAFDATVTQAGTIIPATVAKANFVRKSGKDEFVGTYHSWIIEPAAGFTRDIPYTVTIANVKNAAGTKKITTWSKTFKVEVLAEGLNLADGSVTTKVNKPSTANATFTNVGNDLLLTAANAGADTSYIYIGKSFEGGVKEADYTINVTYSNFNNVGYAQGFIGNLSSTMTESQNFDHKHLNGAMHYYKIGSSATAKTWYSMIRIGTGDGVEHTTAGTSDFEDKVEFRGDDAAPINLKLATKNGVISTYWNGRKTNDAVTERTFTGNPQIMINLRSIPDATKDSSIKFSNFIVTRAVHADTLGESFTAAEPTKTGAFTDEKISISTVVTNNTLVENTIFAACALYDATGAMKNIVISPVSKATSGETELAFDGVDTNGATYAKIFIWNSAASLNPWFPAITVE